ncbi:MAG: transglycosylase SLT domain-containing protein [Gammaproteobacteria bacterium]
MTLLVWGVGVAAGTPIDEARTRFAAVLAAQQAGQHARAATLVNGLEDYPLYPYYRYDDLRRRLHQLPRDEVRDFLAAWDGSLLATRLRDEWLKQLVRRGQWQDFLDFYRPVDDIEMRCQQLRARLETGQGAGLLADARAIWLSGKSLPDACDPAFAQLYASAAMDDALVWARIRLAMAAGNSGLARFLARRLASARLQSLAGVWLDAHAQPARVLTRSDLDDDATTREILVHAVRRLARKDVDGAEQAWQTAATRYAFSADDRGAAAAALAVAAAGSDHPRRIGLLDAVPATHVDATVERYRVREALVERAWPELVRWTETPPVEVDALRWRYWRARALQHTGQESAAQALLTALARERDYYGFLAADALGLEYTFNHQPVAASDAELATLRARPGLARAHELYLLDRRFQARREWYFELDRMERRELEVAAAVAAAWGWQNQAIFALGRARSWDDLELRFPTLYDELAVEHGRRRKVDPARVMAIIRSESAFVVDARSPAGALGLMQLMPATARETARRIGLRLDRMEMLYSPGTNIALGASYLASMVARFGGSFVMAAAAYNAGPHRVRQWQGASCIPAEIWIDTIPFTETRRYVRRALFYAAVYEWRLGREITRITDVMPPIPAAGAAGTTECRT